jgi:virginiamycin B lyase
MRLQFITTALLILLAAVPFSTSADAQRGGRGAVTLPDGAGRTQVEATCASCHSLALVTGSPGYSRQGWQELITTMIALPQGQADTIASYLAAHFPEKPGREAVLIAGPASVTIREWVVPTLGSRPHDPLAARDGSIWWTGQYAHRLGRLDPKSGAMKEYPLPAGTGPHGLVEDRDGNVWFTGIDAGYIGKLDPKTGNVTQFPVQKASPMARGPHTPIFDQQGTLWFTLQSGHVGRLVPSTGEMRIVPAPSGAGATYPYGIQINSQGIPWYVDFRGPRIASVDPTTMAIREITLPNADARPRRIAITPDDVVWYTDYARGYLGKYDPKTGSITEFASPGGRQSQPYGIATVGNSVWYSESAVQPNTLVRFDPVTAKFQTWAIPSGGGVVRNMMRTADGNLALACSGVNRVALVEIRK